MKDKIDVLVAGSDEIAEQNRRMKNFVRESFRFDDDDDLTERDEVPTLTVDTKSKKTNLGEIEAFLQDLDPMDDVVLGDPEVFDDEY